MGSNTNKRNETPQIAAKQSSCSKFTNDLLLLLQSNEHSLSATKRKYAIIKSIRLQEIAYVLLNGQGMWPIGLMPEVMLPESSLS